MAVLQVAGDGRLLQEHAASIHMQHHLRVKHQQIWMAEQAATMAAVSVVGVAQELSMIVSG